MPGLLQALSRYRRLFICVGVWLIFSILAENSWPGKTEWWQFAKIILPIIFAVAVIFGRNNPGAQWWFVSVGIWLIFVTLAGTAFYQTSILWSVWWWYDTLTHFGFGIVASFTAISAYKNFFHKAEHPLSSRSVHWRWNFFLKVIILISVLGYSWELFENFWDEQIQPSIFPWLGKAQHGQIDTLIDLASNAVGALVGLKTYFWLEPKFFNWFYPGLLEENEFSEIFTEIETHMERLEHLREKLKDKKNMLKKEAIRNSRKKILQSLRRLKFKNRS